MVSSLGASDAIECWFNRAVVKSLLTAIVLSVEVVTGITTLNINKVRVYSNRKLLVLTMYTI